MEEPNKRCGKLLMEMERFDGKAKEGEQGAVALVLDLAKAFERVSLRRGVGLGNALQLPKEVLAVAVRVLSSTRGECSSKDAWQSRSGPSRLFCLPVFACCTARCAERSHKNLSIFEAGGFCG